jgi:hypothetical protein
MVVFFGERRAVGCDVKVRDTAKATADLLAPVPWLAVDGWRWDWGCWRPGSFHLAAALLYHCFRDHPQTVLMYAGELLQDVVAFLPRRYWVVKEDALLDWVGEHAVRLPDTPPWGRVSK